VFMTDRVTATSGVKMFEVVAVDGRTVCLHEEWYHVHILQRKPEIARLTNALQEIERALTHAVDIRRSTSYSTRPVYIGPAIGRGFFRNECLHVAVQPTGHGARGFVITVVMGKAADSV
jgi:hypothetical protein